MTMGQEPRPDHGAAVIAGRSPWRRNQAREAPLAGEWSPGSKTNADTALAKCVRMRYMFPEIWNDFGDFGAREPDNAHDRERGGLRDGGAAAAGGPPHRSGPSGRSGEAARQGEAPCTKGSRRPQTCARDGGHAHASEAT